MTNIVKYLIIISLFVFSSKLHAQALIDRILDLNPGGVIYDVAYDDENDLYILVGDFTSIDGEFVQNIAFINATDYTVNTSLNYNVVEAIDGPIYTVEFAKTISISLGVQHRYHLFLGGAFTTLTVDGVAHEKQGFVKLYYSKLGGYAPMISPYTIGLWSDELTDSYATGFSIVHDIEAWHDTVVLVGDFLYVGDEAEFVDGIADFSFFGGHLDHYNNPYLGDSPNYLKFNHLRNGDYLSGTRNAYTNPVLLKYQGDGSVDIDFNPVPDLPGLTKSVHEVYDYDDGTILFGYDYKDFPSFGETEYIAPISATTGSDFVVHEFYAGLSNISNATSITVYKDYVFKTADAPGHYLQSFVKNAGDIVSYNWNGNSNNLSIDLHAGVDVAKNVLFVSANNLTTVDGASRNGLALFCLEPLNSEGFVDFDTTICQGDVVAYEIGEAKYADGYIWEFTGSGVDIGNTGAEENLSDTLLYAIGTPFAVDLRFTNSFSDGELRITPFSYCNDAIGGEDYLLAETLTLPIRTNPLPNADAGSDVTLTCSLNETLLHGHSDTLDVSYAWLTAGDDWLLDVHDGQDTTIHAAGDYILKVENTIGCLNFDTVSVSLDTIRPNFDPVSGPFDLTCSDTVRTFIGVCNNLVDTVNFWVALASNDTILNPLEVSLPGQYQFYSINTANGCIDSLNTPILVYLNQPSPNIKITGYADFDIASSLDTLTCDQPSLSFTAYSDTASTAMNWVDADGDDPIGPTISVEEGGNYYIHAYNELNGCENFTGINIATDFSVPNVILPEMSSLNCSNDSLVLNGATLYLDTLLQWTGASIDTSSNPLTVFESGTYVFTVYKNDNGCSASDSVEIIADKSIDVILSRDTLVCQDTYIGITADYSGEIDDIVYLWDNGSTENTSFYTGGIDSLAIVQISGADDCYGTDTIRINIPPAPILDIEAFQPCGEEATGSIVISPISGLTPFAYSIDDGETFTSIPFFNGLDYGEYTVWLKDSINCLYAFDVTIDRSSSLPTPSFLFSTYNFQTDTIIVIDVSNPPTDSVQWAFSPEIEWIGNIDSAPLLALPETGSFTITMSAFYGSCMIELTKEVFVADLDSTYATFYNQNGIESINLYPNPTSGNFTLSLSFYKKQNAQLSIQDMKGYVYETKSYTSLSTLLESFVLPAEAVNGTYVLKVVSEFDSAYITFILSR
jgi:hypothetical protein